MNKLLDSALIAAFAVAALFFADCSASKDDLNDGDSDAADNGEVDVGTCVTHEDCPDTVDDSRECVNGKCQICARSEHCDDECYRGNVYKACHNPKYYNCRGVSSYTTFTLSICESGSICSFMDYLDKVLCQKQDADWSSGEAAAWSDSGATRLNDADGGLSACSYDQDCANRKDADKFVFQRCAGRFCYGCDNVAECREQCEDDSGASVESGGRYAVKCQFALDEYRCPVVRKVKFDCSPSKTKCSGFGSYDWMDGTQYAVSATCVK